MTVERPHIRRARQRQAARVQLETGPDFAFFMDHAANLRHEQEPYVVLRGESHMQVSPEALEELRTEYGLEDNQFFGVFSDNDYALLVTPHKEMTEVEVYDRAKEWVETNKLNLTLTTDEAERSFGSH